jgi:mono/diheme cytochrome c family protein
LFQKVQNDLWGRAMAMLSYDGAPFAVRVELEAAHQRVWDRAYGGYLAGFGHCVRCHTPPGDGKPFNMNLAFAGGREFPSFGQIPASVSRNITPDPDDGIGKWSDDGRSPI